MRPLFFIYITAGIFIFVSLWFDLGRFYLHQGSHYLRMSNYSAARERLQKALIINGERGVVRYNLGILNYRLGEFAKAGEDFKAVSIYADPLLKAQSLYNRGNCLVRLAENQISSNNSSAVNFYTAALESYNAALLILPKDKEALQNRAAVTLVIKELKKMKSSKLTESGKQDAAEPESKNYASKNDKKKELKSVSKATLEGVSATMTNQEGGVNKRKTMGREEAERLLNEKRGEEVVPSAVKAKDGISGFVTPEKDW